MASLTKDLRRQLERTVAEARKIAEEGAEQSLSVSLLMFRVRMTP